MPSNEDPPSRCLGPLPGVRLVLEQVLFAGVARGQMALGVTSEEWAEFLLGVLSDWEHPDWVGAYAQQSDLAGNAPQPGHSLLPHGVLNGSLEEK